MKERLSISINTSTILKIVGVGLVLWFAYLIFDILVLIFVALVVASLIDPFADIFQRIHLPRGLGVITLYIAFVAFVILIGAAVAPAVSREVTQLSQNFGEIVSQTSSKVQNIKGIISQYGLWDEAQKLLSSLSSTGISAAQSVVHGVTGFFDGMVSFILVLVMAFYFVVENEDIKRGIRRLAPAEYQPYIGQLVTRIKKKLGDWLRAQIFLDLIVGFFVYIGLLIIGAPYALLLGLVAGVTETIPYFGPFFAGVLSTLMVLAQTGDWIKTLFVAAVFIVVQQVENHILVPKVMERTVGLNPIVSIVSLLIGFRLGGVVGALLSIPVATALSVVVADFMQWREHKEDSA
ncbi:AI-2E family transporter [Candidatus Azambacteria bacterium]|nr:AI-2E family transporter [Candidatus Azambacteria bacterium]